MADRRRAPTATNWSELSPEILSAIGKRLNSRIEFFRLRSVCKNWRFSLNPNPNPNPNILSSFLPLKISNPTLPFSTRPYDSLILIARTVLLLDPLEPMDHQIEWILTVEEFNPGKLRILYPLSKHRVTNFSPKLPEYVSLSEYRVYELSKGYGFRYSSDESDVSGVDKVVLCSDCCTAMVLYGKGTLVGVRLKTGKWGYVRQASAFSDVIDFKEMIYAVDYQGNVYVIDHKMMTVVKFISVRSSLSSQYCETRRMYLFESVADGQLYSGLLCDGLQKERVQFRFYRLDENNGPWKSISGIESAIFFISSHSCFCLGVACWLACVVYSEHCLDSRAGRLPTKSKLFEAANEDVQLGIYPFKHFGEGSVRDALKCIVSRLWPPPEWFCPDTSSSEGDEEDEDISLVVGNRTPARDIPSASNSMHVVEQAQVLSFDHNAVGMTFEGLNIKPNLVPTLQKICSKHGNVIEECTFKNKDMISRALESLATVVQILMTNTGQSLNEPQADYIRSALSDLQRMNFKVDWLMPFVKKALAVHKTRALVGSLKEFAKAKAHAKETKLKVLDELAKLDEAEEDLTLVLEAIPALEEVDLSKCLGEGMY